MAATGSVGHNFLLKCGLKVSNICLGTMTFGIVKGAAADEMDEVVKVWNMHLIRPTRNSVMPSGRPEVMYQTPTLYGTQNYQTFVPMEDIDTCRAECLFRETYPCDKVIYDLCAFIMEEDRLAFPTDPYEGLDLYLFLRNNIRQDLENLQ